MCWKMLQIYLYVIFCRRRRRCQLSKEMATWVRALSRCHNGCNCPPEFHLEYMKIFFSCSGDEGEATAGGGGEEEGGRTTDRLVFLTQNPIIFATTWSISISTENFNQEQRIGWSSSSPNNVFNLDLICIFNFNLQLKMFNLEQQIGWLPSH